MTLLSAGKVAYQNTTGTGTTMPRITIDDAAVTDDVVITVTIEKDAHSAVGVTYDATLAPGGRTAGASFKVDAQRNLNQNIGNLEGFTINYTIHG